MTNTEQVSIPVDRVAGSLYGLAYGDAIGYPTEFASYEQLSRAGVRVPDQLRISDDTQMSLAVLDALRYWDTKSLPYLRIDLAVSFIEWAEDPDNNRAPGATCMAAIHNLRRMGIGEWVNATGADSSGCGSVMRTAWVGLDSRLSDELVERVAMLQAVLTHAPSENAYISAACAALTRALATDKVKPGECAEWLHRWADARATADYDHETLGRVHSVVRARRGPVLNQTAFDYVQEGVNHVRWAATSAAQLADELISQWEQDPCAIAGQGWRARECFAVAVGILDGAVGRSGEEILIRGAHTNGDSDSINAVLGALTGAAYGIGAFPVEWEGRLEPRYQRELGAAFDWLVSVRA